jgi:hypothetical protein
MSAGQLFDTPDAVQSSAVLSDDRVYRYVLRRIWDADTAPLLVIGMNPSTADESADDPTIRRCVGFARRWGYGGLLMGNLFAWRSTDPTGLPSLHNHDGRSPVGEFGPWERGVRQSVNNVWLKCMAEQAGMTLAAWGAIKMPVGWECRPEDVKVLLGSMHTLGLTKEGHPRHPLYASSALTPTPLAQHVHVWGPWRMYEGSQERRHCQTCNATQTD